MKLHCTDYLPVGPKSIIPDALQRRNAAEECESKCHLHPYCEAMPGLRVKHGVARRASQRCALTASVSKLLLSASDSPVGGEYIWPSNPTYLSGQSHNLGTVSR